MKRWILIFMAVAAVGGLIAWRLYSKNKDTQLQAQQRAARSKAPPPVTVAPVASRDIVHTYVGVGSVESPFNVKLAPKISGRLDYLQVREGDPVRIGEVLARIDPSQIQAQINQQQAAIAEAQSRLAQAQITENPTNVNITTQIQQQAAGLESARADANQVQQNYASQVAAAQSAVTDAQGRVDNANAAIDNAQANIKSAQANLDNAQVRYNRTYDIYKQGFVAAQDVDDARTVVNVQQQALEVSKGQLRSAQAARDSAVAQRNSAQKQADIVVTKGKADIAAANAKVKQARASLEYARSNTAQKPAYQQNLAALRSSVSAAQAQLHNLQSQFSDTILTSPINGFVTARYMDPGGIASPSQPVITVQSEKQVFVTVSIPEEVTSHIHKGEVGDVVLDALPGRRYQGRITQINPSADPQSRQFVVRLTLDNPQNLVKSGMFARVTLVTERIAGALVVPKEAIQHGKDGTSIIVVDAKGVAHRRAVKTGAEDVNGIQIREGAHLNEQVVILTNSPIKDGQQVRITGAAKAGQEGSAPQTGGGAPYAGNGGGQPGSGSSGSGSAAANPGDGNGGGGGQPGNGPSPTSAGPTTPPTLNGQPQTGGTTPPVYSNPANPSGSQNANPPPQIATPTPSSVPSGSAGSSQGSGSGNTGTGAGTGTGSGASGSGAGGGR